MPITNSQEIIDVHCHFFAGAQQAEIVAQGFARLRDAGLSQIAVMGLVNTRFSAAEMDGLIPAGFANHGDPRFYEVDCLLEFARQHAGLLFPMVDTRCMTGSAPQLLEDYIGRGFRGVKGIYLADEGNDLKLASIPKLFGLSLKQFHAREWQIFEFAESRNLPLLYHMDVSRYQDVCLALLADFPRLRINFPHFGISRRALSKILDRYPNVYTDIAYMRPHIRNNPQSYRDFIRHYPDRVCFGTDALLYQPEIILQYIDLVRSLQLPIELESAIFSHNPRAFLGLSVSKED
jgi:hypothetical protein